MAELLLITPARDEAAHLERTIRAVAAQTQRPDLWLIVDDGSTDATPEILARAAAELPFLRVLQAPQHEDSSGDRLALAAEARAFNWALAEVELADYTHIGKLDADIELSAEYFERLLRHFDERARAGCRRWPPARARHSGWQPTAGARLPRARRAQALQPRVLRFDRRHRGAPRLGHDRRDLRSHARLSPPARFPELTARHHRPVATRNGTLRGRARHGQCAYILRYGAWWVALRSLKVACSRPYGLSGLAFFYGYTALGAAPRRRGSRTSISAVSSSHELRRPASTPAKVPAFFTRS